MAPIECATQAELDAAIAAGNIPALRDGSFDVTRALKVIILHGRPRLVEQPAPCRGAAVTISTTRLELSR